MDDAIATYLPSWLVRLDVPPSSRDPLGLQAHAMAQADRLLPGLNVFTSRARYYTFLCWAIRCAQADSSPATHLERALRLERLLVLCEALQHENEPHACSYIGRRRGRRFVSEQQGAKLWALPTKILKHQHSSGALRLYRTSLVSLGLAEEDDHDEGLGLRLTDSGTKLAEKYNGSVNDNIVLWALEGGTESSKRHGTLIEAGAGMCLSGKIGRHERNYLINALFGGDEDGIQRRDTVNVMFEHRLLRDVDVNQEITDQDPDLLVEDEGAPAKDAAHFETTTNWNVLRQALSLSPSKALHNIQMAGAYQLAALGLNALFSSVLEPTMAQGRLSLIQWRKALAEHAGSGFETSSATTWAAKRSPKEIADELLDGHVRTWPEVGVLGANLILALGRESRYAHWLASEPLRIVEQVLDWTRNTETEHAGDMLTRLLPELILHHSEVSAKKGKGEWLVLDGNEIVKHDPRPMGLYLHSLRFAQLGQLAADLQLTAEDVADET